jgi:hypothetical protein
MASRGEPGVTAVTPALSGRCIEVNRPKTPFSAGSFFSVGRWGQGATVAHEQPYPLTMFR